MIYLEKSLPGSQKTTILVLLNFLQPDDHRARPSFLYLENESTSFHFQSMRECSGICPVVRCFDFVVLFGLYKHYFCCFGSLLLCAAFLYLW